MTKSELLAENEVLKRAIEKLSRELAEYKSASYLEIERLRMIAEKCKLLHGATE